MNYADDIQFGNVVDKICIMMFLPVKMKMEIIVKIIKTIEEILT